MLEALWKECKVAKSTCCSTATPVCFVSVNRWEGDGRKSAALLCQLGPQASIFTHKLWRLPAVNKASETLCKWGRVAGAALVQPSMSSARLIMLFWVPLRHLVMVIALVNVWWNTCAWSLRTVSTTGLWKQLNHCPSYIRSKVNSLHSSCLCNRDPVVGDHGCRNSGPLCRKTPSHQRSYQRSFLLRPGASKNIILPILPTARCSAF